MNHQTHTLRSLIAIVVAATALPASSASARDGIRIPPPGEVIRDVRGFIHGIGRDIKRGAKRVFNDSDGRDSRERELPRPRRDYGPPEKWDGEFYPDEFDRPGARGPQPPPQYRREIPSREIPEGPGGWTSEEQLRREEMAREDARNYRPSPDMQPAPPASRRSTQPGTEGFRAPTPPPQPPTSTSPSDKNKGSLKESAPAPAPGTGAGPTTSTPQTTAPSSDVKFATPVPGKKGLVYPPGVEQKTENMVDVGDFQRGQLVRNPRTGELFRVP